MFRTIFIGVFLSIYILLIGPLLLLYTSFNIAWAIVTEASASFLGFGDPNALTWGSILQVLWASGYTRSAWWWFFAPSAAGRIQILGSIGEPSVRA